MQQKAMPINTRQSKLKQDKSIQTEATQSKAIQCIGLLRFLNIWLCVRVSLNTTKSNAKQVKSNKTETTQSKAI